MKKIKILIADDHKLIRETWSWTLNSHALFFVIAETGCSEEAVILAKEKAPDIVLMDINIEPFDGFEATRKIRLVSPLSKIIGVSIFSQPAFAKKLMQAGAGGYVTKNSSREELFTAIMEVFNGNKYLCNEIKTIMSEQVLGENEDIAGINLLTQKEWAIIEHIREGLTSKEIASKLNISLRTVEVHRHNILKKLKLRNTPEMIKTVSSMP